MRIPVLCYHRIETPPASAPRDSNFTEPSRFSEHLAMLATCGMTGVSIGAIALWQRGLCTLPPRPVAITFDDAYASVPESGLPQLVARGWSATIFAVSGQLGGTNAWDAGAPVATLLTAAALRDATAAGFEIGSHSQRHRNLKAQPAAVLDDELAGSRNVLEQQLGSAVRSFAFPYGSHDRHALQHVGHAGYDAACTLKRWANSRRSNPLRMGRLSAGGPISSSMLFLKLSKLMLTPARQ